jgi:phosphinothricin acetyltransferase
MLIRTATEVDLPGVLEIHADAVARSTAIFTEVPPDLQGRRDWLAAHREPGRSAIVAVEGDLVVGYGSVGPFHAKPGYRHTVENSVYVREGHQGRGTGRALMESLIASSREAGHHVMVALVEAGNEGSARLHRSLGFEDAGLLREVGTKFGRWLDLRYMTLRLDDAPADPAP